MDNIRFSKMKGAFEKQGGVILQDEYAQKILSEYHALGATMNDKKIY